MSTPSSRQTNRYIPPALTAALAAVEVANLGEYGLSKERHASAHAVKRADLENRLRLIRAMGPAVAKGRQKGHTRKIYRLAKPSMFSPKEIKQ